jgi:hypothetical protein
MAITLLLNFASVPIAPGQAKNPSRVDGLRTCHRWPTGQKKKVLGTIGYVDEAAAATKRIANILLTRM